MRKISNRKASMLNALSSIIYQIVVALFSILCRKFFLQYFGVELLGLSSTFSSIITIVSLAETGLGSCVIYRLYAALQKENEDEINELINVARIYLSAIGLLVIVIAFLFIPFLKYVINGIIVDFSVVIYFLLQVLATAFSYFLAYKRLLLTADKKDFVGKFSDLICNIFFSLLKIAVCIYTKNYYLYLLLSILQVVLSNVIVHVSCKKIYPFLAYQRANIGRLREMWPDMKDLFWGGAAAYLFSAADNIILSAGISTIFVGLLGNYTTITSTLKTFILNLLLFMGPIIGNQVANINSDENLTNDYLRFYDYMLFLTAAVILIPEYVLIQDFVGSIWGTKYVLSSKVVVLIVLDQYITIVQDSNGVFMSVTGKFKELKVADGIAAVLNIVTSIIFCKIWGLEGILFGTVISRSVQWVLKARYARKMDMIRNDNKIGRYVFRSMIKAGLFIIVALLAMIFYSHIDTNSFWLRFVLGGIGCMAISAGLVLSVGTANGDTQLAYKYMKGRK